MIKLPFYILSRYHYNTLKADREYMKQYRDSYCEAISKIKELEASK